MPLNAKQEERTSGTCNQRIDHRRHDRRTHAVPEEPDTVAAGVDRKLEFLVETHCPLELRHLQHPHSRLVSVMPNQREAVQGRNRAQGTMQRLLAAGTIVSIVH